MTDPENWIEPEDQAAAQSLFAERPTPNPAFRGALGRRLQRIDPGYGHRPRRLWMRAWTLITGGCLLIVLGGLVAAGVL